MRKFGGCNRGMKMKAHQRNNSNPVINRNSMWQYLIIFISLIFMILSALPNIFQEKNALLVIGLNNDSPPIEAIQIHQQLSTQGFSIESIDTNENTSRIILESKDKAITARKFLSKKLGSHYSVEIIAMDTRPKWLSALGGEPIKLGLDLSGGVLFVLNVDGERAFAERMEHILQSTKSVLRENKIRGVQVSNSGQNIITVKFNQSVMLSFVASEVQKQFPQLMSEVGDSNQVSFFYSDVEKNNFHQEIMQQSLTTLRGRIEELGITEAVTQRQGATRLRIELPGVKNPDEARRIIGATASLDFYQLQSYGGKIFESESGERVSVNPMVIFSGKHIKSAKAGRDEMGMPLVNLALDSIGGDKMLKFSSKNIGKPMVTVFSEYYQNAQGETDKKNKVISVATIQSQLGSRFSITNLSSPKEAQELALLLRAGSLDAPITIAKDRTITATLGESNIQNGMNALMLGVGLTLAFMTLWYRRLGLIANCALFLNLLCLLGLMSLLPGAILTLPGIAGLVLTVGMAVDTNVLIFERIKEEKKKGFSLPLAVEHGYRNAFATIFDANITTLLTALILYSIGYGPVKGFAVTLGLGILTSMFTGVFISRALTNLFYAGTSNKTKQLGADL
jgi:preprotein translocase subunit SecD